jgi:hypothetical protein
LYVEPTLSEFAWVSFVHTLDDALELNRRTGISVRLDVYHVWNDPGLGVSLTHHMALVGLVEVDDCVIVTGGQSRQSPGMESSR